MSRFQFGLMRFGNNSGCGCETPVNDCCNKSCGCGLLSSLRGHFSSMGCGCQNDCDPCSRSGLFTRFRGMGNCGCQQAQADPCCRPRLMDSIRAMVPRRCGCENTCGCGGDAASDAKEPTPSPEPKADGKAQPSASDGVLRLRANQTAPSIDPRANVSPYSTISIGK